MTEQNQKTTQTKSRKTLILAIAAIAVVVLLAVVYAAFGPKAVQGDKQITLSVVDDQGEETVYDIHTDAEFLREVLENTEGLTVEGSESEYGLMIERVNGVSAEFEVNGAYWSVTVNGEYGNYGVDMQPVTDGDAFILAYTVD